MANIQTTENVDITAETDLELAERGAFIKKYEALELLMDENTPGGKAFKVLVTEGYLKEKAVEYTSMLATEHVRQAGVRGAIMEELVAISAFEQYLLDVQALGAPINEDDFED